jgi:spore germination cell wall hydrolase CwlJ-like protein
MFTSIRSALLVIAAASASAVAPAQTTSTAQTMLVEAGAAIPEVAQPQPIMIEVPTPQVDAPALDQDQPETQDAPDTRPSGDLSSMVSQLRSADAGSRELQCLAVGIFFESKSEPLAGQLAVGKVIANRAKSNRFPPSYCGVLFQRSQFSFIRGRSLPAVPTGSRQWQTAVAIAKIVDQDLVPSSADNALFFHARRVSPGWRLKRVASIGNHIFYR